VRASNNVRRDISGSSCASWLRRATAGHVPLRFSRHQKHTPAGTHERPQIRCPPAKTRCVKPRPGLRVQCLAFPPKNSLLKRQKRRSGPGPFVPLRLRALDRFRPFCVPKDMTTVHASHSTIRIWHDLSPLAHSRRARDSALFLSPPTLQHPAWLCGRGCSKVTAEPHGRSGVLFGSLDSHKPWGARVLSPVRPKKASTMWPRRATIYMDTMPLNEGGQWGGGKPLAARLPLSGVGCLAGRSLDLDGTCHVGEVLEECLCVAKEVRAGSVARERQQGGGREQRRQRRKTRGGGWEGGRRSGSQVGADLEEADGVTDIVHVALRGIQRDTRPSRARRRSTEVRKVGCVVLQRDAQEARSTTNKRRVCAQPP